MSKIQQQPTEAEEGSAAPTSDAEAQAGVTSAEGKRTSLPRIIAALSEATEPNRVPEAEAFASSHEAMHVFGWDSKRDREEIAASAGTIPALFEQPGLLAFMDAFHFVPDAVFTRPRLSLERAADHEHEAKRGEYVVPEGYTFHICELTNRPFVLEEGALCPVLMYDSSTSEYEHPEDADVWRYPVHPALVNAGPEAVHAALWRSVRREAMKAAEAILSVEQATQVASGFDPAAAGGTWPRRAFQTWESDEVAPGEEERRLGPVGYGEPKKAA